MNVKVARRKYRHGCRTSVALAIVGVCSGAAILFSEATVVFADQPLVRHCIAGRLLNTPRPRPPQAFNLGQIRGVVTSPRLATVDAGAEPQLFKFTFSGRLNAPPARWHIELEVLRIGASRPERG